jgi:hypothetical protein
MAGAASEGDVREIEATLDERLARLRARMLQDAALVSRATEWEASSLEHLSTEEHKFNA